jgi:hypothetical protein
MAPMAKKVKGQTEAPKLDRQELLREVSEIVTEIKKLQLEWEVATRNMLAVKEKAQRLDKIREALGIERKGEGGQDKKDKILK